MGTTWDPPLHPDGDARVLHSLGKEMAPESARRRGDDTGAMIRKDGWMGGWMNGLTEKEEGKGMKGQGERWMDG